MYAGCDAIWYPLPLPKFYMNISYFLMWAEVLQAESEKRHKYGYVEQLQV
jgi:hypothetical protein